MNKLATILAFVLCACGMQAEPSGDLYEGTLSGEPDSVRVSVEREQYTAYVTVEGAPCEMSFEYSRADEIATYYDAVPTLCEDFEITGGTLAVNATTGRLSYTVVRIEADGLRRASSFAGHPVQ